MRVFTEYLWFTTSARQEFIRITDDVARIVERQADGAMRRGVVAREHAPFDAEGIERRDADGDDAVRAAGLHVTAEAREPNLDGILECMQWQT